MKHKRTRSPKNDKKFGAKEGVNAIKNKSLQEYVCAHCGGALKFTADEASCVMCGRPKGHKCPNCLHKKSATAA